MSANAFVICVILGCASPPQAYALRVVRTVPAQNALNVPQTTNIEIIFDTSLKASTINDVTIRVYGLQSGFHFSKQISQAVPKDTVIFHPQNEFRVGELVTVT